MDRVRFGVSATLSGKYSLQGIESFNGLNLWAEHTNKNGGLLSKKLSKRVPVDLIFYDDKSNPENTKQITRKLIQDKKVDILLGPYSSSLTRAAAKISEYYNRVLWNYGGSTDEITRSDFKKVVSTITPASRYIEPFLEFVHERYNNFKTVAIVFAGDSGFSSEVARGAVNHCEKIGIDCKQYTYKSGNKDFRDIVNRLSRENLKYVLGVGRFEDDLNLAIHLKNFHSCLVAASIEEFKIRLKKEADGFFSVAQWEPHAEFNIDFGVTSKYFTDLYQKKFRKIPDYTAAQSFNIGIILEKFIEENYSVNENSLRETIVRSNFCTFYGNFEFDRKTGSQTGHKTLVTQWQKGKREIMFPQEQQTSEICLV